MTQIEQTYKDWLNLLDKTGNKSLLEDPYNVWIEAFHVSKILTYHDIIGIIHAGYKPIKPPEDGIATLMNADDLQQLQLRTLRQIIELIETKGRQTE